MSGGTCRRRVQDRGRFSVLMGASEYDILKKGDVGQGTVLCPKEQDVAQGTE